MKIKKWVEEHRKSVVKVLGIAQWTCFAMYIATAVPQCIYICTHGGRHSVVWAVVYWILVLLFGVFLCLKNEVKLGGETDKANEA